jgi:hypothetical protein
MLLQAHVLLNRSELSQMPAKWSAEFSGGQFHLKIDALDLVFFVQHSPSFAELYFTLLLQILVCSFYKSLLIIARGGNKRLAFQAD